MNYDDSGMKFYEYRIADDGSVVSVEFPIVITKRVEDEMAGAEFAPTLLEEAEHVNLDDFEVCEMGMTLLAVRPSDESRFTPEEWAEILEKIERGEIHWQDWD